MTPDAARKLIEDHLIDGDLAPGGVVALAVQERTKSGSWTRLTGGDMGSPPWPFELRRQQQSRSVSNCRERASAYLGGSRRLPIAQKRADPSTVRAVLPADAPRDVWLAERRKGMGGSDAP